MSYLFFSCNINSYHIREIFSLFAGSVSESAAELSGTRLGLLTADGSDFSLAVLAEQNNESSVNSSNRIHIVRLSLVRLESDAEIQCFAADGQAISLDCWSYEGELYPRELKRRLYKVLSRLFKLNWPWGSLTGVRPTYVAWQLQESLGETKARDSLIEDYELSAVKAELALTCAGAEQQLLENLCQDDYALYIGVPFCPARCSYCSFTTVDSIGNAGSKGSDYLCCLKAEVDDFLRGYELLGQGRLKALYVGGGTPAALAEKDFALLVELVFRIKEKMNRHLEVTFELGREDCISKTKLDLLKAAGFNRICLNPQSKHVKTLERIGRPSTPVRFEQAFRLAKESGMNWINCDLIAGLEGESADDFLLSLAWVQQLRPQSITLHALAGKKGSSEMHRCKAQRSGLNVLPDQDWIDAYAQASASLGALGYSPYYLYRQHYALSGLENCSYVLGQEACLYNVMMMSDAYTVVSLGCPAVSKLVLEGRCRRLAAPKSFKHYHEEFEQNLLRKRDFFTKI